MRLILVTSLFATIVMGQGTGAMDVKLTRERTLSVLGKLVPQVVLSVDKLAVTDHAHNGIAVFDIDTGQLVERIAGVGNAQIHAIYGSDNGLSLAAVNLVRPRPDEIAVFDFPSALRKKISVKINEGISNVAFSWNGQWFAAANPDYAAGKADAVSVFSAQNGQVVRTFVVGLPRDPQTLPRTLAFSPDDAVLAVGDSQGGITILDVARMNEDSPKVVRRFVAHSRVVGFVEFAPDGRTLATGDGRSESVVRLWDTRSWQLKQTIRLSSDQIDQVQGLRFSPKQSLLAICSMFKVAIYDTQTGKEIWGIERTRQEPGGFASVDFSTNGEFFAFVKYQTKPDTNTVEIWKLAK